MSALVVVVALKRKLPVFLKSAWFICPQGKMIMQDKLEKERNDAKNAVEEYVYEMRDKLSGDYEKFVSEDVSVSHVPGCCVFSKHL